MTPLGIVIALLTVAVFARRRGYPQLLAAAAGLPIGVVVIVAGQPVKTFFALGAVACAWLFFGWIMARKDDRPTIREHRPGALALVLFLCWSIFVTILAPTLFEGMPVLVARGGIDEQFLDP